MAWSDVYPVLTEEMIRSYQIHSLPSQRNELDELFGVKKVINSRESNHVVSVSLFWKNAEGDGGDLPDLTRDIMVNAHDLGLITRFHPWKHYVIPLLEAALLLQSQKLDVVLRVYLASDLEFLVDDLVAVGCEVMLMNSSSLRHNPGAMWRFLALGERGKLVTIADSDRGPNILEDIQRTEVLKTAEVGCWRIPYGFNPGKIANPGYYRPIIACHFGAVGGVDINLIIRAFMWHHLNNSIKKTCTLNIGDDVVEFPVFGVNWPDYGFDEWFLLAALYPRLAMEGVLTLCRAGEEAGGMWLALDIEYVTWANCKSSIVFYRNSKAFPAGPTD